MIIAQESGQPTKCGTVCSMLHSATSDIRRVRCSQVKQAALEAQLEELRDAIAHQSQLDEASKQEEAWLRQLLLPFQSQVCRTKFTTHLLLPAVGQFPDTIMRFSLLPLKPVQIHSRCIYLSTAPDTPFVLSSAAHHRQARSALYS